MLPLAPVPVKSLFKKWLECFNEESMETLLQNVEGVQRVVTLMIINHCFNDLRLDCEKLSEVPLKSFKSITHILLKPVFHFYGNGLTNQIFLT